MPSSDAGWYPVTTSAGNYCSSSSAPEGRNLLLPRMLLFFEEKFPATTKSQYSVAAVIASRYFPITRYGAVRKPYAQLSCPQPGLRSAPRFGPVREFAQALLVMPSRARRTFLTTFDGSGRSCSHTRMALHPNRLSAVRWRRSRLMFLSILDCQYSVLLLGLLKCLGQPCQKQLSRNTATLSSINATSGVPGRPSA